MSAREIAGFRQYATGRRALVQCPRCGFVYPYGELRMDGQQPGLLVCAECYDPKHPQDTPVRVLDAVALEKAAPLLDPNPTIGFDLTAEDGFTSTFGPGSVTSGIDDDWGMVADDMDAIEDWGSVLDTAATVSDFATLDFGGVA